MKINKKDFNFHKVIFDPDDERANYIGGHQEFDADSTAAGWEIFAQTFATTTASKITLFRQRSGKFSDRAALLP